MYNLLIFAAHSLLLQITCRNLWDSYEESLRGGPPLNKMLSASADRNFQPTKAAIGDILAAAMRALDTFFFSRPPGYGNLKFTFALVTIEFPF
jgi:hypothetical protein